MEGYERNRIDGVKGDQMKTTTVQITQYLCPNARKTKQMATLEADVQDEYEDMLKCGCRLEAEVLTTGEVSLTVWDEKKFEDIDIAIVQNGKEVLDAIITLLKNKKWRTEKK
jgi:hypothetical protein